MQQTQLPKRYGKSWLQVQRLMMERLSVVIGESPKAGQLITTLAAKVHGRHAFVGSYASLGDMIGCHANTARKLVKVLENHGFIEVLNTQRNAANVFVVSPDFAWTGGRGQLKTAEITALVALRSDEQNKEIEAGPGGPENVVPVLTGEEEPIFAGEGLPPPSEPPLEGLEPDFPRVTHDMGSDRPVIGHTEDGQPYDLDTGEVVTFVNPGELLDGALVEAVGRREGLRFTDMLKKNFGLSDTVGADVWVLPERFSQDGRRFVVQKVTSDPDFYEVVFAL